MQQIEALLREGILFLGGWGLLAGVGVATGGGGRGLADRERGARGRIIDIAGAVSGDGVADVVELFEQAVAVCARFGQAQAPTTMRLPVSADAVGGRD